MAYLWGGILSMLIYFIQTLNYLYLKAKKNLASKIQGFLKKK